MNEKWKSFRSAIFILVLAALTASIPFTSSIMVAYAVEYNTQLISLPSYDTSGKTIDEEQIITLSEEDKVRANNGELDLYASVYVGANGSRNQTAYLKVTCYNGSTELVSYEDGVYGKYSVAHHRRTFKIVDKPIPANTTHIRYYSYNHIGTSGDLEMNSYYMEINDRVAPTYIAAVPVTSPAKYKVGTKIRYQVMFSEAVVPVNTGHVKFKVGTQEFTTNSIYTGQSSDRKTLYYDLTLPSTTVLGDNLPIAITGFSGVSVTDDAGNTSTTIPASLSQNNGFFVDNKPPQVSSFSTGASANALYKAGERLQFDATFDEYIVVNGTPRIDLSNGRSAEYIRQTTSDTKTASFFYTISPGDDIKNIAISSIDFNGITDKLLNFATSASTYSATAYNSFMNDKHVSIDTQAPVAAFAAPEEGWCKTSDIVLSPTDNISGVKEIYAAWTSIGGSPTFPAAANVDTTTNKVMILNSSGAYELHVKLVDEVGNTATQKSPYKYYFDFDGPVISANAAILSGTNLVRSVTANAVDSHSEAIDIFTYSWVNEDGATVLTGNAKDGISIPEADGVYVLNITASDNLGNTSSKSVENLAVDSIGPVVAFNEMEGIDYKKSYTVNFSVADEKSGVDKYYYIINYSAQKPDADNDEWKAETATSLSTAEGASGTYYFHIKAVDKVGNVSIYSTDGFNIDNTAPTISLSLNGNAGIEGRLSYEAVVSISDAVTPFYELIKKYAVSESETCPEELSDLTDDSITIEDLNTIKYIYIVAADALGNETVFKSNSFIPDLSAPTGGISKPVDVYFTNSNTATIDIEASDDYSSDIWMQMMIDDVENEWEDYATQKTVSFEQIEGEHTIGVKFKDACGNISQYWDVTYCYDITPPQIDLVYSTDALTNEAVTVTASATDNVSDVYFETDSGKTFSENGSFEFIACDEAGNRARATAEVNCIDKTNPSITFESAEFDGKKHKDAYVTINASDANGICRLEYAIVRNNDAAEEYTSCSNGETVEISGLDGIYKIIAIAYDNAGNSIEVSSQGIYFDNTPPIAYIEYSPNSRTAQNVTASISLDEAATITNNSGSNIYVFTDNDSFTFEFEDEAGNATSETAEVDWIDRSIPKASVVLEDENGDMLRDEEWTNKDIRATIVPPANSIIEDVMFNGEPVEDSDAVCDLGSNQYTVSEYGILSFTIKDMVTYVTGDGEALIRVDKTAPTVEDVLYSHTEWTNQNVTVTIIGEDDLGTVSFPEGSSHVFTENGSFQFILIDNAGNRTGYTEIVDWIDKDTPVAEVKYYVDGTEYDITEPTNKNVVAKVNFDKGGSPVRITNNSGDMEYEFSSNGSFIFMFTDSAGNESSIKATVSNIDKVPPTGYIVYSYTGWTNKDVTATLAASDDVNKVSIINNPSDVYTFSENGSFTFEFRDSAGNRGIAAASVSKIDKTPPKLTYELSTNDNTPFPVYAFLKADEVVTIINNEGKTSRQFSSNGEFTFKARDRAGNISEITAVVTNISKETTPVVFTYSTTDVTNEDVYAEIAPKDDYSMIYVTNNSGQKIKKFTENGEFTFNYKNAAGIPGEASASVSNIDKTPPEVNVTYSHSEITKDDVVASFTADEEVTYPHIVVDGKYRFTKNMKLQIPVRDKAGNIKYVVAETDLIDKNPPVITMNNQFEAIEMGRDFDVNSGVTVTDDKGLKGDVVISGDYDVNVVGDYVITYSATDNAGNVSAKEKYLTVYDPEKFNVIVNGKMAGQGQITTDSRDIAIETINSGGRVKAKMLTGKKNTGDFKTKGAVIELSSRFPSEGYYTLYITDDERNSQLIYIFIAE